MSPTVRYNAVPLRRDFITSVKESKQQVLWIGCSDSGFEEINTVDLLPDETIVLRNIGNMFLDDGLACLSMVQYAVDILKVKHIVVCGHYGCGLVLASSNAGLSDPWLSKLTALRAASEDQLNSTLAAERDSRFVELNVLAQIQALQGASTVASAIHERGLKIHGLVYDRSKDKAVRLEVQQEQPAAGQ